MENISTRQIMVRRPFRRICQLDRTQNAHCKQTSSRGYIWQLVR